jgi:hypothetical protein
LSAGLFVLALSALSRNSRYVALVWLGIWFVSGITSTVLQTVDSQQRRYAYYRQVSVPPPDFRNVIPPAGSRASTSLQDRNLQMQQMQEYRAARRKAYTDYQLAELDFSKNDWRPLVSYSANLSRIGQALLGTNETWLHVSQFQPNQQARDQMLATYMGPQYPWYWSAAVLAGIFGLSACILNLSIKSLDRLK